MPDKYGVGDDPYCYPGTEVLKNRLNLTAASELNEVEAEITAVRAQTLEPQFERFDAARFRQIHRHLFQDIYDWAGEYRTVDISKGQTRFCTAARIEKELERLCRQLEQAEWLCGLSVDDLIPAVADFYCEINIVHPFREGNGRAQRLLFEELIVNAGFDIDWGRIDADEWVNANQAGYLGDLEPLIEIFSRALYDPNRD
ncbi:MAG: putative adenosine monophosphate-protein transferase Fic [Guyparkeria sp.]